MTNQELENAIKSDTTISPLILLEGQRYVIRIDVDLLRTHPTLTSIRGKTPEIDLLRASMANTGGTSVYTPCLYAEVSDEGVFYYIADGHQRVQAAKDNGQKYLVCQVITRWHTVDQAFRECINIQSARFEMSDQDVFSILKLNNLTVAEVATQTGRKETTLQKMKNVCDHALLTKLIDKGVITTNVASNIVVKCNKNGLKINAFLNSLQDEFNAKEKEADHWRNKLGPNPKGKLKEKTDVKTYFKGFDWKSWEDAVDGDGKVKTEGGRATLDLSGAGSKASADSLVVGDTASSGRRRSRST